MRLVILINFLLFGCCKLFCQDCTLIITEHITLENSEEKLIDHIEWIEQILHVHSTDIMLHVCTGNNELSRVGDGDIRSLIESDSLLMYNTKRIDYYKEFELLTDQLINSFNHCISQTKFNVFYSVPSDTITLPTEAQLDMVRKIAVVFGWTDSYGKLKSQIDITFFHGYKTDADLDAALLKKLSDVK